MTAAAAASFLSSQASDSSAAGSHRSEPVSLQRCQLIRFGSLQSPSRDASLSDPSLDDAWPARHRASSLTNMLQRFLDDPWLFVDFFFSCFLNRQSPKYQSSGISVLAVNIHSPSGTSLLFSRPILSSAVSRRSYQRRRERAQK